VVAPEQQEQEPELPQQELAVLVVAVVEPELFFFLFPY
jgi:hypothetical protein